MVKKIKPPVHPLQRVVLLDSVATHNTCFSLFSKGSLLDSPTHPRKKQSDLSTQNSNPAILTFGAAIGKTIGLPFEQQKMLNF